MSHTIEDLRQDLLNLDRLHIKSPLYIEIRQLTKKAHRKLSERLSHDLTDFDDAFQRTMMFLTKSISDRKPTSLLEHYLIHEHERRKAIGEELLITEFRRIFFTIIKNDLLTVHNSGYVESLVDRSVRLLKELSTVSFEASSSSFMIIDAQDPGQLPTPNDIVAVANECSIIAKIPQTSEQRNSPVYSTPNLEEILQTLISRVNHFRKDDLYELFSYLLTSWLPSHLSSTDETTFRHADIANSSGPADAEIGNEEFSLQAADQIWRELSENQRRFMHAHTWNVLQAEIAHRVEFIDSRDPSRSRTYSRPWIVQLHQSTLETLRNLLSPFEQDEQLEIVRIVNHIASNYHF